MTLTTITQQSETPLVELSFSVADPQRDRGEILHLRELVYVHDQGRLVDSSDMGETFDRFDRHAVYIIARAGDEVLGVVKVIADSPDGLPCEAVAPIALEWAGRTLVEFGHLMTVPHVRNRTIGLSLMREALHHSIREFAATHILGDFFVDDAGGLRQFYRTLGFVPVSEPYEDDRFKDAPLSIVGMVDVTDARRRMTVGTGRERELLGYFFADAPETGSTSDRRADTDRTKRQRLAELKAAHNHPAYAKLEFLMGCGVQGPGEGSWVTDEHGNRFLALFDQYGNQTFGFSHERIVAAIQDQVASLRLNGVKTMFEEEFILLTERLAKLTKGKLPYVSIANSGAEAIETALKLARATTGRSIFVTAAGAFHGKTFGALSASGRPDHVELLRPMLEQFRQVPFGDLDAMEAAMDGDVAAVLLEPIQAEGGVIVPPEGYLREVRRLCAEHGALLIVDEMQTAFGRTGTFFAFEGTGVLPDLVCIGKSFGGGVLPISAVLTTEDAWQPINNHPSAFGSSLGGNPLACRVGLEAVSIASEESFLAGVGKHAAVLHERLAALAVRHPTLIRAHRGIGMMHGLEFHDDSAAGLVLGLLYEQRVMSAFALYDSKVVRIQPPLVISDEDLDTGLTVLESVLDIAAGHLARAESASGPAQSTMEHTVTVDAPVQRVLDLLASRPRLLDPFAADPQSQTDGSGFRGTFGHDVVIWTDTVEQTGSGVALRAVPDWLWRRLDRTVDVHPAPPGRSGSRIDITISWDAGIGRLEGIYAGRQSYFVGRRLTALTDAFAAHLEQ